MRIPTGIIVYFAISALFLSVPVFFALKHRQKIPIRNLVIGLLFGPIIQGIVPMLVMLPPPSAHPLTLIFPRLHVRQGKTATQILGEIASLGQSIGGLWPMLSIKVHLAAMELVGTVRRERLTIREFTDRFEREKTEERHFESWEILDEGEMCTGMVQLYFQGSDPKQDSTRFFWLLRPQLG